MIWIWRQTVQLMSYDQYGRVDACNNVTDNSSADSVTPGRYNIVPRC